MEKKKNKRDYLDMPCVVPKYSSNVEDNNFFKYKKCSNNNVYIKLSNSNDHIFYFDVKNLQQFQEFYCNEKDENENSLFNSSIDTKEKMFLNNMRLADPEFNNHFKYYQKNKTHIFYHNVIMKDSIFVRLKEIELLLFESNLVYIDFLLQGTHYSKSITDDEIMTTFTTKYSKSVITIMIDTKYNIEAHNQEYYPIIVYVNHNKPPEINYIFEKQKINKYKFMEKYMKIIPIDALITLELVGLLPVLSSLSEYSNYDPNLKMTKEVCDYIKTILSDHTNQLNEELNEELNMVIE